MSKRIYPVTVENGELVESNEKLTVNGLPISKNGTIDASNVSGSSSEWTVDANGNLVPKDGEPVSVGSLSSDELSSNTINNEYRLKPSDGESRLRDLLNNTVGYGDRIIFPPNWSITATGGTLTVPKGVMLEGSAKERQSGPATITKGFNGDLMEYSDWFTAKNIQLFGDSANFTGGGLVPVSTNKRELYLESVSLNDFAGPAFVVDETFLSTFIGCEFGTSQDGLVVDGTTHSPHNAWIRCRFTNNNRAGIDVRRSLDQQKFIGCLIDLNKFGIDTERSQVGQPIPTTTAFTAGTQIVNNDGPGIICQGATAAAIRLSLDPTVGVRSNNQNTPTGLTTPVGDIHSENGGEISGTVGDIAGDIRRYNSNAANCDLIVLSGVGDLTLPDTMLVSLHENRIGTVDSTQSHIRLDPTGGGKLIFRTTQTYSESNVTTDRTFDANATTTDELADVLGTLINDLRARGIVS